MDFERHFSTDDLERLFDERFVLPDGFLFGVANAGFQVEGGFNGQGEPLNNWVEAERAGKVERSGEATRFWTDYPEQLELAQGMGLNAFRLGVEWARVQPETSVSAREVPAFDERAIEAYSDMIAGVMRAGMEPMLTLHHFVHPYWLGLDFWLDSAKLKHFVNYVEKVTERLNTLLVEKHELRPIRYYITINEPNGFAPITYMLRVFPHRKAGYKATTLALSNLIDAHCRAYDTIHRVYSDKGWEKPLVTYNTISFAPYHIDKWLTDLLNARRNGVSREGLRDYLAEGCSAWNEEIAKCPEVRKAPWVNRKAEALLDHILDRRFDPEMYTGGLDSLFSSDIPEKLDYLAVDFYDPFPRNMLRAPSLQDIREKRINFNAEHWEWALNPRAMYHFLKAEAINGAGLPVLIVENGMSYKVYRGRVEQRRDGATRDRFLQSFLYEAMRALKDGLPLGGYFYWTMVDNYEWGSFDPRFGLFTVDRSRSPVRIASVDTWGINAGKVYSGLIAALRSGDRGRMVEAFSREDW